MNLVIHVGLETKTGSMEKIETMQKDKASLSRVDKILCKSKEMVESCSKKKETVNNAGVKIDTDKPQLASQLAGNCKIVVASICRTQKNM